MAKNLELITYIYNNLQQGYPLTSIKEQLVSQGFSEKQINQSVDFVYANYFHQDKATMKKNYPDYQTPKSKKVGMNEIVVLVLIIFGISLIGFAAVFLMSSGGDDAPDIVNRPDATPETAQPETNIPEDNTDEDIPETNDSADDVEPADTTTETTADTDEKNEFDFEEQLLDPFQGKDPEEGFNEEEKYTSRQIDLKVDYFKETNPTEALRFCEMYSEIKNNYCIIDVVEASGEEQFCEGVSKSSVKDDCYLTAIISDAGDLLTCEDISNSYKKNTCKTLVRMRTEAPEDIYTNNPEDAINYGDVIVNIT